MIEFTENLIKNIIKQRLRKAYKGFYKSVSEEQG